MSLKKYKLGELLQIENETNADGKYNLKDVRGISIQKIFIDTKANMEGVSLKPYILVKPDFFAYVTVTSRNSGKITLAYNNSGDVYIVSSSYVVFSVAQKNLLSSDYLFMYFNRPEFDRYARFNSWGSARETFSWEEMCDIDIFLPPLEIQKKYVAIYKAMLENQKAYERGLDDLKLVCDGFIDRLKNTAPKKFLKEIFREIDNRNEDGKITNIQGINITKQFMNTVADMNGVNLNRYKIVRKGQFAFSGMQTGRDECIRIALYEGEAPIIISPAYTVFEPYNENILPEYVMMWFQRKESDRRGWFMSDSSVRTNLDNERFYEIQIPIPEIKIQKSIANIYKVYTERKRISERLKAQIKNICPVLIKGAMEEGKKK